MRLNSQVQEMSHDKQVMSFPGRYVTVQHVFRFDLPRNATIDLCGIL